MGYAVGCAINDTENIGIDDALGYAVVCAIDDAIDDAVGSALVLNEHRMHYIVQ